MAICKECGEPLFVCFCEGCQGECDNQGGHLGEVELCSVTDKDGKEWGTFKYCAKAQEIDESRGFIVEPAGECETCEGEGTVLDYNKFTLDQGKWMRSFEETINMECPDCKGAGYFA